MRYQIQDKNPPRNNWGTRKQTSFLCGKLNGIPEFLDRSVKLKDELLKCRKLFREHINNNLTTDLINRYGISEKQMTIDIVVVTLSTFFTLSWHHMSCLSNTTSATYEVSRTCLHCRNWVVVVVFLGGGGIGSPFFIFFWVFLLFA